MSGKTLQKACKTFTPAQWAHITLKVLPVVVDTGATHRLIQLMKASLDCDGVDIGKETQKERQQLLRLRAARLISYPPITFRGEKVAKVNWWKVAEVVGEVKPAPILGSGYGIKAMF